MYSRTWAPTTFRLPPNPTIRQQPWVISAPTAAAGKNSPREGMAEQQGEKKIELVATTGNVTKHPVRRHDGDNDDGDASNGAGGYIETAQWTVDGTTVLTSSSSNEVSAYIIPEDLLSPRREQPLALAPPQATVRLPERSNALAPAPYFALGEPYTHQLLVSSRDHPIQLFYLSPPPPPPSSSPSSSSSAPLPPQLRTASPRHGPRRTSARRR
jgi:hypothetical protein